MNETPVSADPLVAVVSHLWRGHVPAYHRLLVERGAGIGWRVISVTPEPCACRGAAATHRYGSGAGSAAPVRPGSARPGPLARWMPVRLPRPTGVLTALRTRRNWRALGRTLRAVERSEGRPLDLAFIVFLGYHFLEAGVSPGFVGRIVPCPWAGIWNGPTPGRDNRSPLAAWLWPCEAPLRARNSRMVWVPDRRLAGHLQSFRLAARVAAMPEIADLRSPADASAPVQRILALAAGRRITGLLGSLSLRKGILTLIEAARIAARDAPDLFFFAAGEFSRESCGDEAGTIAAAIAKAPANFLFLPGRIPEGPEFNAHVAALDVLYAVYRDFPFQSNLLTKAAHFRKPVVVASGGVMADCTRDFELGATVPSDDPRAVLAAIRSVLAGRRPDGGALRPRFEEYAAINDTALLDQLLASTLRKECP